jgi:hypothetical protein
MVTETIRYNLKHSIKIWGYWIITTVNVRYLDADIRRMPIYRYIWVWISNKSGYRVPVTLL